MRLSQTIICGVLQVSRHLLERCILRALVQRGKAVVLVTHQLQCLPFADLVVVLDASGHQVRSILSSACVIALCEMESQKLPQADRRTHHAHKWPCPNAMLSHVQ